MFRRCNERYRSPTTTYSHYSGLQHERSGHRSSSTSPASSKSGYLDLCHDVRSLLARAEPSLGNNDSKKLWRRFVHNFCAAVREGVRLDVESRVDWEATKVLEMKLGRVGADTGTMPNFAHNPGALCGYTLRHFGRVRLLIDLMTQSTPSWLVSRMEEISVGSKDGNHTDHPTSDILRVASLGGGPGFDFIAWLAWSEFRRGPRIRATVYEYEPNWEALVNQIKETSVHVLETRRAHDCSFGSCDITLPLDDATNATTVGVAVTTDSPDTVYTCSYVVAENAIKLRRNDFIFFRQLFSKASPGTLFFFTETTHRLWPELIDIARRTSSSLRIAVPHIRRGKAGCQLVLLKDDGTIDNGIISTGLSASDQDKYDRFKRDNEAHLAWLERRK